MKNLLLSFAVFAMFSTTATAGFHIEPYVGYGIGKENNYTRTTTNLHEEKFSGLGFGARVGLSYLGLLAGATYDHIGVTGTDDDDNPKIDRDYKNTNLGVFAGYEFPLGLRFWASYYFSAKSEVDNTTAVGDEYKGSGYSVGVGMSVVPMVLALNVEYKSLSYDEFTDASLGTTSTLGPAAEEGGNYIFVSLSAPLGF